MKFRTLAFFSAMTLFATLGITVHTSAQGPIFAPAVAYGSGGRYAVSVAVADVNLDGKPDLVVANNYVTGTDVTGIVGVLLGNGDGTFQSAVTYPSGGVEAQAVAVADVNGDGKPDLVVAKAWERKRYGLMDAGGLAPKSIANYMQIVKMVVASVVDEQTGEEMYPRKWNSILIDAPVVDKKKQKAPIFSGEIVTGIISKCPERYRTLFAVCAASGLRMGEALGIDIKDVSPDGSVIKIRQKAWKGQIHDYLKTINGEREVDLHSSVAMLVKKYVGFRQSGLLFCTRTGKQLSQSNILRRGLHPTLKELKWQDSETGIKQAGSHAFRRFRNTYLRNHTLRPDGVIKFWMGHAGENMSDLYDKIRQDMQFRREVVEKAGLGFEISLQKAVVGPNGPKIKSKSPLEMAASA